MLHLTELSPEPSVKKTAIEFIVRIYYFKTGKWELGPLYREDLFLRFSKLKRQWLGLLLDGDNPDPTGRVHSG